MQWFHKNANTRVPDAIARLQKHGRAAALEIAAMHDANSIAKLVGLVHKVRREHDCAPVLLAHQKVPDEAAR